MNGVRDDGYVPYDFARIAVLHTYSLIHSQEFQRPTLPPGIRELTWIIQKTSLLVLDFQGICMIAITNGSMVLIKSMRTF